MNKRLIKYYADSDYYTLVLPQWTQRCLSVRTGGDDSLFETMRQEIDGLGGTVLSQFVMAGAQLYEQGVADMGNVSWPLTWIQGDACQSGQAYSSQIVCISGIEPTRIILDGETVGYRYDDDYAAYCQLSSLKPADASGSRADQTRSLFERMEAGLAQAGMQFSDTVRTWLYLDRLLDWYGAFNEVRTAFFREQCVFDIMVPASTGIGAANPWGTALLADLLAVKPKGPTCQIQAVASPLQCPALDYKSSFSRAVELAFPTHRQLLVSGTASIDPDGRSVHIGDCARQIELTMRVVQEILRSRGMGWHDLSRGIAYFKNRADVALWDAWVIQNHIPRFPLAISHADVCRDELLFEIEVDALQLRE
jgi:enamine deaminase RidA (YjgF/YER057c/UK114 family)